MLSKVKPILKRAFRKPVLFIASLLEKILLAVQKFMDSRTEKQLRAFTKFVVYPFVALFIILMFLPNIVMLINFLWR